jgi:choice-of-anchor B domain-containing protein
MYKLLLSISILLCATLNGQEHKNIALLDRWFSDTIVTNTSLVRFSGCWGFTYKGLEYAIIGSTEGTHFFELSKTNTLKPAGFIEGRFNSSLVVHREFKTYRNYAYSVCDEGNSSLQIIDLNYLPDSVVKVADIQDERFGKTHNIFIDTTNALLYACLVTPIVSDIPLSIIPLRVFSLADPTNPVLLWQGPDDIPVVHDCYVRNNIAFLNCGEYGIRIYDFTNPSTPDYLNNLTFYQDQGYNHQGWLSPNGKTYIFADETNGKRVKKCTIGNDYSIHVDQLFGTNFENNSIPHNIMCTDEFAFVAYYNEGLRIFDIRNNPFEIASYDTYTASSTFKMNGAWGVYSNYQSGRIIVSDRQNGLFLFHFDQSIFIQNHGDDFYLYPNPTWQTDDFVVLRSANDKLSDFKVSVFNSIGELIHQESVQYSSIYTLKKPTSQGIYIIKIEYTDYLGELKGKTLKLVVN